MSLNHPLSAAAADLAARFDAAHSFVSASWSNLAIVEKLQALHSYTAPRLSHHSPVATRLLRLVGEAKTVRTGPSLEALLVELRELRDCAVELLEGSTTPELEKLHA